MSAEGRKSRDLYCPRNTDEARRVTERALGIFGGTWGRFTIGDRKARGTDLCEQKGKYQEDLSFREERIR